MLATCRRNPTKEEYKKCVNSFPYLFSEFESKCYAGDGFFEQLGFQTNVDIDSTPMQRDATISQECRQQYKCLSHPHQQALQ
eukprot:12353933-Ditylum_brightwellii.AAC.1